MRMIALAAIIVLSLCAVLPAQVSFQRTYGGTATDQAWSVVPAVDGGYFVAGHTSSYGAGLNDAWLIRTGAAGETLWTRTFGGEDFDEVYAAARTADSGWVMTGETYSQGAGLCDLWLVRTDASGDTLWTRTFGGIHEDRGRSVVQTQDGGYIIGGSTASFGPRWNDPDYWLVRTDAAGDTLWTRTFGGTEWDYAFSVTPTDDGGCVIAGVTESFGAGEGDLLLVRADASGDSLWTRCHGGESDDWGCSVAQTDDGGCIVAGFSYGDGAEDAALWLVKTDASGDSLWTRTFGGTVHDDWANSVTQTPDGGYIIGGVTRSFGAGGMDAWLVKTDSSGDTLWTRTFGGPETDECHSVAQADDGGYVLSGWTESSGHGQGDAWLVKTDSLGLVGIAEPHPPAAVMRAEATFLPRAGLMTVLLADPDLSVFDASGRQVVDPEGLHPGVLFLRSATTTRRVLLFE